MLTRLHVENFKAFASPVSLELRPLTILFGKNSVGKSALVRALALTAESVSELGPPGLNLRSQAARGAPFSELLSQTSGTSEIVLGLRRGSFERFEVRVRELGQTRRQIVDRLTAKLVAGPEITLSWNLPESETTGNQNEYLVQIGEAQPTTAELDFRGLVPVARPRVPAPIASAITSIRDELWAFKQSATWVGAVRRPPPRIQTFRGAVGGVLPDGVGAAALLADAELRGDPLPHEVSAWFEEHMKCRLLVQRIAAGPSDYFSLVVSPIDAPARAVNICDTGEGLCQVLPVVVAAKMALRREATRPTLLLEQPELHLQPKLHGDIATLLASVASKESGACVLAETHSGNFVLKIQLEIAKGRIDPNLVRLFYLEQDDEGRPRISSIDFDQQARPQPAWPPNVFSEHVDLSRALVRERMSHEASD
jgi:hypothetical protein